MFTRRAKDIQRCLRNIESFTDNQARVVDCDYDELKSIKIELTPNAGPYKDGRFVFEISMPLKYPEIPPDVSCSTFIYHPNIDPTGEELNVCLSLFDEWESTFGLEDTIQGLLFLFYEPNLEDPLSPYFSGESYDTFEEDVARSMRGEQIDGVQFDVVVDITKLQEEKEKAGDIELEVSPVTETNNTTDLNTDTASVNVDETDADSAGTLSEALDVVAVVKELVDQVVADAECDTEVARNVKNVIHSADGADLVTEIACESCDTVNTVDDSVTWEMMNDTDDTETRPVEIEKQETVIESPVVRNDEKKDETVENAICTVESVTESAQPSTSKNVVNAECKTEEPTAETTNTSDAVTDAAPVAGTSEQETPKTVEEKPAEKPEPVPKIEFDNLETILKKVEETIENKAEEFDKKEELEAKKDEEDEDEDDVTEDEFDEDEEDDEEEKPEKEPVSLTTTEGATAGETSGTNASCSVQTNTDAAEAGQPLRIDALNRQNSKMEKFELIFEKIARENKSTQTDFSVFMFSNFGLQYIKPVDFLPTYPDIFVEFPLAMLTRIAFRMFRHTR